jgi:hypothetical protein
MNSFVFPLPQEGPLGDGYIGPTAEWPADAVVDYRALGKGVSWALGMEGAAALFIYFTWHLLVTWHLLHLVR